jgi:hypothetical protein
MALSMTVLRISLTLSRALSTPAMPPQAAPASAPTNSVRQQQPAGSARSQSAKAVDASAPTINCPSPPMLITPPRKEMQMPSATNSSGVILVRVAASALTLPNAPFSSTQ